MTNLPQPELRVMRRTEPSMRVTDPRFVWHDHTKTDVTRWKRDDSGTAPGNESQDDEVTQ